MRMSRASTPSSSTGIENHLSYFYLDTAEFLPNQTNTVAVEIHNVSSSSSDISFDLSLRGIVFVPEPNAALQLIFGTTLLALLRSRRTT